MPQVGGGQVGGIRPCSKFVFVTGGVGGHRGSADPSAYRQSQQVLAGLRRLSPPTGCATAMWLSRGSAQPLAERVGAGLVARLLQLREQRAGRAGHRRLAKHKERTARGANGMEQL